MGYSSSNVSSFASPGLVTYSLKNDTAPVALYVANKNDFAATMDKMDDFLSTLRDSSEKKRSMDLVKQHSILTHSMIADLGQSSIPPSNSLAEYLTTTSTETNNQVSSVLFSFDSDKKISEDSILRKILACIPLIGIVPTTNNENSLTRKIYHHCLSAKEFDNDHMVRLINVKNHYKMASIVRNLLTLVAIVSTVALGIVSGIGLGLAIVSAAVVIECLAFHAWQCYHNGQVVAQIKQSLEPNQTEDSSKPPFNPRYITVV